MQDDTTLAGAALGLPVDGLSVVVRMAVRGAIEAATEAELTRTLGRAAWERAVTATGYRHGTITRTVVTGVEPVALTLPRARLAQADGTMQEWQNPVVPRYARRTVALDATLARLYLCGGHLSWVFFRTRPPCAVLHSPAPRLGVAIHSACS